MSEHVLSSYLMYTLVEYRILDFKILLPKDFDRIATLSSGFHATYLNCNVILPDRCVYALFLSVFLLPSFSLSSPHPALWKLLLSSSCLEF